MFTENLSVFFNPKEHAVPVVAGSQHSFGNLEMPEKVIANGAIITTEYALWYETATLDLSEGDTITVDGVSYKVRDTEKQSDGKVTVASLTKI